jgi:HAD superfamily hydrolase (TIGR01458 family)
MEPHNGIQGLLLDIDGVLAVSWRPIPGSIETLAMLRGQGIPMRLITNTTTHTRVDLATTLREAGFEVDPDEIITAVVATVSHLNQAHPGARVFLISDGDARGDMGGIDLVQEGGPADVVVIGGGCDRFSYGAVNHAFRLLMNGAALVGMHRNMYWKTAEGLELDGGAYIAGLEEAAGVPAVICGKPTASYFQAGLDALGLPAERVAMVGDDVVNDVTGAQAVGMKGVLVRTGKFLPTDLEKARPDAVLGSFADVPAWLSGGP